MQKRITEGSYWKESKQIPFPNISVLRTACCATHSCCQELIGNRGFMRNRKYPAVILLLNVPWQFPLIYYICKKGLDQLSLFSVNNFCIKTLVNNKYNCNKRKGNSSLYEIWLIIMKEIVWLWLVSVKYLVQVSSFLVFAASFQTFHCLDPIYLLRTPKKMFFSLQGTGMQK